MGRSRIIIRYVVCTNRVQCSYTRLFRTITRNCQTFLTGSKLPCSNLKSPAIACRVSTKRCDLHPLRTNSHRTTPMYYPGVCRTHTDPAPLFSPVLPSAAITASRVSHHRRRRSPEHHDPCPAHAGAVSVQGPVHVQLQTLGEGVRRPGVPRLVLRLALESGAATPGLSGRSRSGEVVGDTDLSGHLA